LLLNVIRGLMHEVILGKNILPYISRLLLKVWRKIFWMVAGITWTRINITSNWTFIIRTRTTLVSPWKWIVQAYISFQIIRLMMILKGKVCYSCRVGLSVSLSLGWFLVITHLSLVTPIQTSSGVMIWWYVSMSGGHVEEEIYDQPIWWSKRKLPTETTSKN